MILSIVILSVLCFLLFLSCFFLIMKVWESEVLTQSYQQDYERLFEKYEHVLSQLSKHGFEVKYIRQSSCYIELEKEDE
jgi:hypothetical protein